jgi:hypothetical protein
MAGQRTYACAPRAANQRAGSSPKAGHATHGSAASRSQQTAGHRPGATRLATVSQGERCDDDHCPLPNLSHAKPPTAISLESL